MSPAELLKAERIISTREFQSKFAAMVKKAKRDKTFYHVVRNGKSLGVFLPIGFWNDFLESFVAPQSRK